MNNTTLKPAPLAPGVLHPPLSPLPGSPQWERGGGAEGMRASVGAPPPHQTSQLQQLMAHNQLLHGLISHLVPNYNPHDVHNLHQQVIDGMRGLGGAAGGPIGSQLMNKMIGGAYNANPTSPAFHNVDPSQFGYPPDITGNPTGHPIPNSFPMQGMPSKPIAPQLQQRMNQPIPQDILNNPNYHPGDDIRRGA